MLIGRNLLALPEGFIPWRRLQDIRGLLILSRYPDVPFLNHRRELLLNTGHGDSVHGINNELLITDSIKLEVQIRTHILAVKKDLGDL